MISLCAMQYLPGGNDFLNAASVGEFLSLIAHADYVVTSSFHGTAFSIIFQRNFMSAFPHPEYAERVNSLLSIIGIRDRLISPDEYSCKAAQLLTPIDYSQVTPHLEAFRESSREWLRNALSNP